MIRFLPARRVIRQGGEGPPRLLGLITSYSPFPRAIDIEDQGECTAHFEPATESFLCIEELSDISMEVRIVASDARVMFKAEVDRLKVKKAEEEG